MALTTYAELQTSIANWCNRSDIEAEVRDFIKLAEARINRRLRVDYIQIYQYTGGSDFTLSDSVTTNWLLQKHPDVYLYGALCESGPFLQDISLLAVFESRFERAMLDVQNVEDRAKGEQVLTTEITPAQLGTQTYLYDINNS